MSPDVGDLTHREMAVLVCVMTGKTNREIATELDLNIGTVKGHLSSVYRKLGVYNRTEAALAGLRSFPMSVGTDPSR